MISFFLQVLNESMLWKHFMLSKYKITYFGRLEIYFVTRITVYLDAKNLTSLFCCWYCCSMGFVTILIQFLLLHFLHQAIDMLKKTISEFIFETNSHKVKIGDKTLVVRKGIEHNKHGEKVPFLAQFPLLVWLWDLTDIDKEGWWCYRNCDPLQTLFM